MFRSSLALMALLVCVGPAAAEDLVGTWKLDISSLADNPSIQKMAPEQRAQAVAMGRKMLGQMTLTFSAKGQLVMELNPTMRRSGTYVVKDAQTITTVIDGKTEDLGIAVKDGVLTMQDKGSRLVFKRGAAAVKAPPPAPLDPKGKPVDFAGIWQLDKKGTLAAADEVRKPQLTKMMSVMPQMGIEFTDGVLKMTAGDKTQTGSYTFRGTRGTTTVLDSKGPKGKGETMNLQMKDGRLHVEVDGRTMVFQR
jgi:hypothetical protein